MGYFRAQLRATHTVLAGYLVYASTALVTPGLLLGAETKFSFIYVKLDDKKKRLHSRVLFAKTCRPNGDQSLIHLWLQQPLL